MDKAIDETLYLNKKYLKILNRILRNDSFGIDDYSKSARLLREKIIKKNKSFLDGNFEK